MEEPESRESEGDVDPMVCMPIKPFVIQVVVEVQRCRKCTALIDSGCTRCLMSEAVATSLGVGLQKTARPISFEQIDGSLLGGVIQPRMLRKRCP